MEVIKAHPWLDYNYKDAWPIQSLIQTVLANIKTQDRRTGMFFLLSNSALDSCGLDTGRINANDNNDQNIDPTEPTESDNDGPDVNERAVSTRPHEEADGSGGEEQEVDDDDEHRACRSDRDIPQDGLGDSSDEGRQDGWVTWSVRSRNRTITS